MPDPTRLLTTLRQAVRSFQNTPGRTGHLVHLAGPQDVLVAGDLHGNLENFRRLLERADLRSHPDRHLVFQELVHGPFLYPLGGDKSHQLIDLLAALKCQFPRQVHMLLGNHELAQWTNQWIAKKDTELNDLFRQGIETAYGGHAEKIYDAYLDLFAAVPWAVRTPNRVFLSHSLPRAALMEEFDSKAMTSDDLHPGDLIPGGQLHSLVWGRDTSVENVTAFMNKVDADWLITGHIPCEQGFATPNDRQLILDCMGTPAAYCLFPVNRPVTFQDLLEGVKTL
ncbi:MAG TPA: metallophosphoesterase [Gemmataceae bacterium]|nr:metallophosphoesterase [Gemmataceae bacterium]